MPRPYTPVYTGVYGRATPVPRGGESSAEMESEMEKAGAAVERVASAQRLQTHERTSIKMSPFISLGLRKEGRAIQES